MVGYRIKLIKAFAFLFFFQEFLYVLNFNVISGRIDFRKSTKTEKNEFFLHYKEENSLSEAQGGGRGKEKGILFTLALNFNNNASNSSKVFGLASSL